MSEHDCADKDKWVLFHDGTKVVKARKCTGQSTTHEDNTMVIYDTEELMEADIVTLGLTPKPPADYSIRE